jgi:Uncharacterized protein conserved in bacteria
MFELISVFGATLVYNVLNGLATILISRGMIKAGAFFDAIRNVMSVLILSYVALHVRDNYWLLAPLFFGYFSGMLISGAIMDYLRLGDITITALVDGDKHVAREFAETLSAEGIMNTSFIGTGSRSKTVAITIIAPRKQQDMIIKTVKRLAKSRNQSVKITVSDTAEWRK